ncbi:unnamed protein product [Didymodactylos carnosus]|uniref:C2H2-type domain-containing protein n=1 Tax=Didymodactylos carnosus TaxID=1234261 RepID=A0A814JLA5_9BILA|nr:unnamed protein product [Didymodactylos carnosus]CAF3809593.1 unnamed protein product [Didymodactylos carnosus]
MTFCKTEKKKGFLRKIIKVSNFTCYYMSLKLEAICAKLNKNLSEQSLLNDTEEHQQLEKEATNDDRTNDSDGTKLTESKSTIYTVNAANRRKCSAITKRSLQKMSSTAITAKTSLNDSNEIEEGEIVQKKLKIETPTSENVLSPEIEIVEQNMVEDDDEEEEEMDQDSDQNCTLANITNQILSSAQQKELIKRYSSSNECENSSCETLYQKEHFHCSICKHKVFQRREDAIRHIKWHRKREESFQYGFLRFSTCDNCQRYFQNCLHNGRQTHYHCLELGCTKVYASTSDVQMHATAHKRDQLILYQGFRRFRCSDVCNWAECQYYKNKITHFHCLRQDCHFSFKQRSDIEKHKMYHAKDEKLMKDGFKKFSKKEYCHFPDCNLSKTANHIHCMRQDCGYILHSISQMLTHKRKHEKHQTEANKNHQAVVKSQSNVSVNLRSSTLRTIIISNNSSSSSSNCKEQQNGLEIDEENYLNQQKPIRSSSATTTDDDTSPKSLYKCFNSNCCLYSSCKYFKQKHFHCLLKTCQYSTTEQAHVLEHESDHTMEEQILRTHYSYMPPFTCMPQCELYTQTHYHCVVGSCGQIFPLNSPLFSKLEHYTTQHENEDIKRYNGDNLQHRKKNKKHKSLSPLKRKKYKSPILLNNEKRHLSSTSTTIDDVPTSGLTLSVENDQYQCLQSSLSSIDVAEYDNDDETASVNEENSEEEEEDLAIGSGFCFEQISPTIPQTNQNETEHSHRHQSVVVNPVVPELLLSSTVTTITGPPYNSILLPVPKYITPSSSNDDYHVSTSSSSSVQHKKTFQNDDTGVQLIEVYLYLQRLMKTQPPVQSIWSKLKSEMFYMKQQQPQVTSGSCLRPYCKYRRHCHYHCKQCDQSFMQSDKLQQHLIKHGYHISTIDKNLVDLWETTFKIDISCVIHLQKQILDNVNLLHNETTTLYNQIQLIKNQLQQQKITSSPSVQQQENRSPVESVQEEEDEIDGDVVLLQQERTLYKSTDPCPVVNCPFAAQKDHFHYSQQQQQQSDSDVPEGFQRFSIGESCLFNHCSYSQVTTHYHCLRLDCCYHFTDKNRFQTHLDKHVKSDQLLLTDFQMYRGQLLDCNNISCKYRQQKQTHYHCLRCKTFSCHDTSKILSHRKHHEKEVYLKHLNIKKTLATEQCLYWKTCIHYKNKQMHYHCCYRQCKYSSIGPGQMKTHRQLKHIDGDEEDIEK